MSWFCVKIIPADKPYPQDFPLSFAIRHSDFGPSFPCWPAGGITVNLVVMTHSLLRKVFRLAVQVAEAIPQSKGLL